MSDLGITKRFYSSVDPACANLEVVVDDDHQRFIRNVYLANEKTGECYEEYRGENGDEWPVLGKRMTPFKIIDRLAGTAGKPKIQTLFRRFQCAVVMGGGSSLKKDMLVLQGKKFRKLNPVRISVNHHGHKVFPAHFIAFTDRHSAKIPEIRDADCKKISIWGDLSDYSMDSAEVGRWFRYSSSFLAMFLAANMAKTVVLVGFDLYQDGVYQDGSLAENHPLERQLREFQTVRRFLQWHKGIFCSKGSPLEAVFPVVR